VSGRCGHLAPTVRGEVKKAVKEDLVDAEDVPDSVTP